MWILISSIIYRSVYYGTTLIMGVYVPNKLLGVPHPTKEMVDDAPPPQSDVRRHGLNSARTYGGAVTNGGKLRLLMGEVG